MNKILNWTFGACFRTLGRFLAIFIVGVLLVFIGSKIGIELPSWLTIRVNASDNYIQNWADGLTSNYRVDFRGCDIEREPNINGQIGCNNNSTITDATINTFSTGSGLREFVTNTNPWTLGQNGFSITAGYKTTKNYLYNVNFYFCTSTYINDYTEMFISPGTHGQKYQTNEYYQHNFKYIGKYPGLYNENYDGYDKTFTACYKLNALVVPKYDGIDITHRIRQTSGTISNFYYSFIAMEVKEVGPWFSELENVIKNSGFATAESVEQVQQSVNQIEQEIQQTNDTITNDDITGAEDSASGFFENFTTETFGLTSIITAPLNAINSLINSSCNNLVLPLPFVNKNLTLPCMNTIYSNYFKGFFDLYQIITTGLISYYIIVRIFNLVKDFKNPEHDEIEVMDL